MKKRHTLLAIAGGFAAGYAAVRAAGALDAAVRPKPPYERHDAAAYGATRRALALAGIARSLAAGAFAAFGPVSQRLERSLEPVPVWAQPALFALANAVLDGAAELPVDFIEGREIERRYGLSEQSAASWLSDYAKQQAIAAGVTAILSALLGAALRAWPRHWPYLASAAALPLLVAANVAIPVYVLPLFNTYVPLEGPLEQRLRALATRFGVGDAQILRVDMSKQTKKANAFVIGIGRTHRIVVGDTLIEHFTPEEIEFVVAHELGHYVSKDTWRFVAAGQLSTMAIVFAAFFALGSGKASTARVGALARLQFVALLVSQVLRPALSAFSRSREWAADRFALETTGDPATGAAAFRRLRDRNLAEDEQPAWFEFLFSTHPPLKARIAALEAARTAR